MSDPPEKTTGSKIDKTLKVDLSHLVETPEPLMAGQIHCSSCGFQANNPMIAKCPHDGTDLVNPVDSDPVLRLEYDVLKLHRVRRHGGNLQSPST